MWYPDHEADMAAAARALQEGRLVAFPTETVYGLGGNGLNPAACRAIYAAKGRPADNPLILHIADGADLSQVAEHVPETAQRLAKAFWPGPLTLIVPRRACVPDAATAGLPTVAVRCPDHPVARALIRLAGLPLAAPSANSSGRPSPTAAWHVADDLGDKIAGIIDGGQTAIGIESTIVDCSGEIPTILRPGGLAREAIEAVIGEVRLVESSSAAPKAPGMKYRHYAPAVPVHLLERNDSRLASKVQDATSLGLLLSDEEINVLGPVPAGVILWNLGPQDRPDLAAARLFDGLRRLEAFGVQEMLITVWPDEGIGLGLMNRIRKLTKGKEEQV